MKSGTRKTADRRRIDFREGESRAMQAPRPCSVPRGTTRPLSGAGRETVASGRSRNRCKGESYDSSLTAGAHQRDFEGPFGERLRAGAHGEASVTLRARRRVVSRWRR